METFFKVYESQLRESIKSSSYLYTSNGSMEESSIVSLLLKMYEAIKQQTYSKDSVTFKNTCKTLGIKHTYKAINDFIVNHV